MISRCVKCVGLLALDRIDLIQVGILFEIVINIVKDHLIGVSVRNIRKLLLEANVKYLDVSKEVSRKSEEKKLWE